MPGTTRYSATFDRPYEEEDRADPPPPANARRSRSQSCFDGRPYTPLGGRPPTQRSSSTDNGPAKGPEHIPTRTAKTTVKAHNNPFQFVKVGTCPLYKKAEEQLQKAKEVKKPDVLKEEEEEWQSNLDSWKSRRRKMSEDVFRRQEEIKQLELEEQIAQLSQKKTKTFSEMVESRATRATRGRALSLCLISSPLEFQNWEYENKTHKNGSCSYTDESGDNSTVNSEDEGVSIRGRLGRACQSDSETNHRTNGDAHIEQNGSKLDTQNGSYNKLSDNVQMKPKESSYIDSGLESISSSHRAGDTPDSGSDFSQDSNSSIDCDSPRTGVNILEEFNSKSSQMTEGHEITVKLNLKEKGQDFGFTFLGGKDEGQVLIASVLEGSKAESSGIHLGDRIITIDGCDVNSKKHIEIAAMVQKGREKGQICLLLWRHTKSTESTNGFSADKKAVKPNKSESTDAKSHEKSIESENEMYVDDFEELRRQSELLNSSKKSETTCTNAQAQTNGNKSPTSNKDVIPLKTSSENSAAPKLKDTISNGAAEEPNKNVQKTNSELDSENQKKNIVKVKRVRRKGVYALNVDPNQISQEGISTNSLFPLSPVTELPSPADETKTMSSTLSSNNTVLSSNSQKEISNKEKPKEAEVKLSSPIVKIQENNKTVTTSPKTVDSKVADIPPSETKSSGKIENKSQEKTENKAELANVPSSPTTARNKEKSFISEVSQNDKSKPPTAPKKLKVKVKKGTASENTSITSPTVKETSSSVPLTDAPAKTAKEQPASESKSSLQIADKQVKKANGVENALSAKTMENGAISCGTTAIAAATEAVTVKSKIPAIGNTVSNDTGNQPLKVGTKVEAADAMSTNSKQSKVTPVTPEEDKSKPVAPKKVKVKTKGSLAEQTAAAEVPKEESTNSASNIIYSSAKNIVKENQPKKEEKPASLTQDKQEKAVTNTETTVSPTTKENGVQDSGITTRISTIVKDKSPVMSNSADKTKNLSLKIELKNEPVKPSTTTPVVNTIAPKTPQDEKLKPVLTQKKESKKLKENGALPNGISPVTPAATKDKTPITSASADKTKNLSLKVEPKNETVKSPPSSVINVNAPKTPQDEISKPVLTEKKKESKKAKGSAKDQMPKDSSQLVKETSVSSAVNISDPSIKNITKENEPAKEQKPAPPSEDKQAKMATKNETTVPSLPEENGMVSAIVTTLTSSSAKDKIPVTSASADKTKNLSLKVEPKNETVKSSPSPVVNANAPKTPQDEISKPVLNGKKRESKKVKGNAKDQMPKDSSQLVKETSVSSAVNTSDPSIKNIINENEPVKEQKPAPQEKQAKMATKKETTVPSLPEENGMVSAMVTTLTSSSATDKIPVSSASADKTKNLSLKVEPKNETVKSPPSPVVNANVPKMPQDEKSKPVLNEKKKESKKVKGSAKDQTHKDSSLLVKETSISSVNTLHPSTKNIAIENEPVKEQNPAPLSQDKQAKMTTKNETTVPSLPKGNGIVSAIVSAFSSSAAKDKIPVTSTSVDKAKTLSLKTEPKNETVKSLPSPVGNTTSKTTQDEKSKPALAQKKESKKLKGSSTEQIPSDTSQVVKGIPTSSGANTSESSAKNTVKENQLIKEQKPAFLTEDKQAKVAPKNVTAVSPLPRENGVPSARIVTSDAKPTATKDKTPNRSTSADKTKNLSLKIGVKNESVDLSSASPSTNAKPPKTPQGEKSKPVFSQKKENTKLKVNSLSSKHGCDLM